MATAKKTSFSDAFLTLEGLEAAVAQVRKDGAASDPSVFLFPLGMGYSLKAEWSEEASDPAAPPADERPQPTTVVQPDGLTNDGGR